MGELALIIVVGMVLLVSIIVLILSDATPHPIHDDDGYYLKSVNIKDRYYE